MVDVDGTHPHESRVTAPLVTVAIPVFNGELFVTGAIESVLGQTFSDFELLISDNHSTDRTAAICDAYASKYSNRIRFFRQTRNLGPFLNLKFVTDEARGQFLVWLAHDDVLHPDYLNKCLAEFDGNRGAVSVCTDFRIIDQTGSAICIESLTRIRGDIRWSRRRAAFFQYPILDNWFYSVYGMTKTSQLRQVMADVKAPQFMSQIELPVLARLAIAGEIVAIPVVARDYRRHKQSLYHR